MKHLCFLLISFSVFSQSKPLSFEIDKLTSVDSSSTKRVYTLEYHIENTSDKTVSFVLNATNLIPINDGSQSEKMYFKLFENEKSIEMNNIIDNGFQRKTFMSKTYKDKQSEEAEKLEMEEALRYFEALRRKSILNNIVTLKPKETIKYKACFSWNRERYRKQGEMEYYIHETNPHFIELAFNLMLEVFEKRLSPEEYKTISSNPDIIKGWYTSNKVPIDFRE